MGAKSAVVMRIMTHIDTYEAMGSGSPLEGAVCFAPPKGKVGSSNLPWDTIYLSMPFMISSSAALIACCRDLYGVRCASALQLSQEVKLIARPCLYRGWFLSKSNRNEING